MDGNILKEKRIKLDLTQEDVAQAAGISTQFYSFIENGKRFPSPKTARNIALILGFPKDWPSLLNDGSDKVMNEFSLDEFYDALNKKLKALREKNNMSVKDVANKLNIQPSYYESIENNTFIPSLSIFYGLAQLYDVDCNLLCDPEKTVEDLF